MWRIHRIRVDGSRIRKEKVADSKILLKGQVVNHLSQLSHLCISQTQLLAAKAKTIRPWPWRRVFCSFVFSFSSAKGFNPETDAYVL